MNNNTSYIKKKYMIVYENSSRRINNFYSTKLECVSDIELFPAIDTINYYSKYSKIAFDKKYCTGGYIDKMEGFSPGKLGCNLSHQSLYRKIAENPNLNDNDWILIMEDDLEFLTPNTLPNFENMVREVVEIDPETNFLRCYTFPIFICGQFQFWNCIGNPSIYEEIDQWGTQCYIIPKHFAKKIAYEVSDRHIDYHLIRMKKKYEHFYTYKYSKKMITHSNKHSLLENNE